MNPLEKMPSDKVLILFGGLLLAFVVISWVFQAPPPTVLTELQKRDLKLKQECINSGGLIHMTSDQMFNWCEIDFNKEILKTTKQTN